MSTKLIFFLTMLALQMEERKGYSNTICFHILPARPLGSDQVQRQVRNRPPDQPPLSLSPDQPLEDRTRCCEKWSSDQRVIDGKYGWQHRPGEY